METVGVRELKAQLSRHLRRVRRGTRLLVTERGRSIASLAPIEPADDVEWAQQFVADGGARWSGGKPTGARRPPTLTGTPAASIVLRDRR